MGARLVILGAGDFAREVVWLVSELQGGMGWTLAGLLDDEPEKARQTLQRNGFEHPVLGRISSYLPQTDDRFICAIGNPKARLTMCELIRRKGGTFVSVIHPTAAVGPGSSIGDGVIVCRNVVVTTNVIIGNHVHLNVGCVCGHDSEIGDGCTLSPHCDVTGHAVLERGVFLGTHASVIPRVRIREFAVLGAGSVAFRNVPAGQTWLGVPAEPLLS